MLVLAGIVALGEDSLPVGVGEGDVLLLQY